ncbi:MAG: DUF4392 domain-containing protein [Alphaproteobacteria bacterium]|nr:DUF4392 domain-containing protein [Alphaproteobacteria bacterium]
MQLDPGLRMQRIGQTIDRLVSLDLWCKFAGEDAVGAMYQAAVAAVRPAHGSLTLAAAERLKARVRPGKQVLICTGNVLPPWMIIESDGPPGAAVLARMLNLAMKATPVVLVEGRWVDAMRQVVIAAGLTPFDDPAAIAGRRGACAVRPFPAADAAAAELARSWLAGGQVDAVLAIEATARSENGFYQTGTGSFDNSSHSARFDYLFEEANARGVPTVGIGDHGGELGLGGIAATIRQVVPTARVASDPVRGGITPVVPAEIPLVVGISNWGGYGLAAMLAALCGKPELVHDAAFERRLLRATAQAGMIEGMGGLPEPAVDGLDEEVHASFVELLRVAVKRGMEAPYPRAVGFIPAPD